MTWTVNWMYMILMTSLTGGVFTLIWYGVSRALERMGYLNITYKMLKVILIFWYCPFMYYLLLYMDRYTAKWGGWLFAGTPAILRFSKVFTAVWLCGVVIFILTYVWAYAQIRKCLKQTIDCDLKTQMQFKTICKEVGVAVRRTGIRQSYHESIPKVMGLFRQTIVIPVQEYSEEQLQIVLKHELTHVKHKDLWFKNFTLLMCIVHFMNPVMWLYWKRLERWSEFACDYSVCTETQQIRQYYEVIFSMMQVEKGRRLPMSSQLLEHKSELRDRMEHVTRCYKMKARSTVLTTVMVAVMVVTSCGSVFAASLGVANVSDRVYKNTDVWIEMPPQEDQREAIITDEYIPMTEGEVETFYENARGVSSYTFTWKLKAGEAMNTGSFSAKSGNQVFICVSPSVTNKKIRFGVVQPDSTKAYMTASGDNDYKFYLNQSGNHKVFVQNISDTTLTVTGTYIVYR